MCEFMKYGDAIIIAVPRYITPYLYNFSFIKYSVKKGGNKSPPLNYLEIDN